MSGASHTNNQASSLNGLDIQWRYLNVLWASLLPLMVYFFTWYSIPFVLLTLGQSFTLRKWLGGYDKANVEESRFEAVSNQRFYSYITLAHVVIHGVSLATVAWILGQGITWYWMIFFIISVGLSGGVAIITAHELVHRREKFESFMGGFMLSFVCYGTFKVEHVRGHHVNVSTPEDASSARLGQSLYDFLPRAMLMNTYNGFRLEAKRLRRIGKHPVSIYNELIWWSLLSLAFATGFYFIAGLTGLMFFFAQALIAISTLERVNYIEHYGLERRKLANGRYERVSVLHSWNASGRIQNAQMINLMRHSDHHANPMRRFQVLRHNDESPQLPRGYQYMLPLAFMPKKWFALMDPLAKAHMEKLRQMTLDKDDKGVDLA